MPAPLTTRDAELHVASMNNRTRKMVPEFMGKKFPPVYIYNVSSHAFRVQGLAGGEYNIPACEPGKLYSKPCIVNGFIADEYDLGDGHGNMSWNAEEGTSVAKDIVGIGSFSSSLSMMTTNREWWGVFIAEGEVPTSAEIAAARSKLDKMMALILQDGDRIAPFQNDPRSEKLTSVHFEAAAYLRQPRQWANPIVAMQDCPGCGEPVKPNIAKCGKCGAILDRAKAIELGLIPSEVATAPLSQVAKVVQR